MPHDKNNVEVSVGDEVTVRCKVTHISTSEGYCNLQLETVEPMPPHGQKMLIYSINTHQVEVVKKA